ncbi:MAG: helix-turn-helix domain-containing protein [bacterium]
MEIGEKLKQTRIEKELTLEDIEKMTKIRKKYLKAIEEENFGVIPGKIYIKSFIRTYGNSLGLNGMKLAQEYENRLIKQRQLLEEKQKEMEENSFFDKYKILIISLLILFILIGTLIFYIFYMEGNYIDNFRGNLNLNRSTSLELSAPWYDWYNQLGIETSVNNLC